MNDFLISWLGREGYLPHGYCFSWSPGLLWSMVGADAVIAASYYSIPVALVYFARRRPDVQFKSLLWLFSGFIFACGTTHLLAIWTIWRPDYALETFAKVATAGVSIVTAFALWPLIPKALRIPSVRQLQDVIDSLDAEVHRRRTAEDHLADLQQSLAVTLGSIGAGFVSTDREGRIVRMNEVAERVTGWPQAEAKGRSLWEVFVREDRPAAYLARNPVDILIERNITLETIDRIVCIGRDGTTRTTVETQSAPTYAPDGSVRGLAVVFRDVSQLLQARAESSRLAAIVESSNDAIVGQTLDGSVTSWNRGAQALFGYRADEMLGQSVRRLVPPERADEEMRTLARLAAGEVVPTYETQRCCSDGRSLDVAVTLSPIRDEPGRVIGASMIARDVTEQKLAEVARRTAQALEAENRQILAASRLKSEFLANMSHELRTPLNAIIGFADLIHSGKVAPGSPRHNVFVGHIRTSGRHLLQLINDILDLSKVEAGKLDFFPEPADPGTLAAEVLNVLHEQAATKAIHVQLDIDPALGEVTIDRQRLKQVLYNYLSNALKFTPAGGRVQVRMRVEDKHLWRLEVEDTGVGIRPEDIGRLFTEFQQLDAGLTKAHSGTGLGLALTRRLVEAQGGSVGVRSEPGAGAVFHALLPRRGGAGEALSRPMPFTDVKDLGQLTEPDLPRRSVLVVEDDPNDARALVDALQGAGFAVAVAATATQALALSRERRFAAITLDLLLPDRPGFELLADIRVSSLNREVPVLVVTLVRPLLPPQAFPVSDVLAKPVDGAAVVRALRRSGVVARDDNVVMVVDDDLQSRELMTSVLAAAGHAASAYASGEQALAALDTLLPAAMILDLSMPGLDGFELLERLRARPTTRMLPVFVWTSRDLTQEDWARLLGTAQAVIPKSGMDVDELLGHIRGHIRGEHE